MSHVRHQKQRWHCHLVFMGTHTAPHHRHQTQNTHTHARIDTLAPGSPSGWRRLMGKYIPAWRHDKRIISHFSDCLHVLFVCMYELVCVREREHLRACLWVCWCFFFPFFARLFSVKKKKKISHMMSPEADTVLTVRANMEEEQVDTLQCVTWSVYACDGMATNILFPPQHH